MAAQNEVPVGDDELDALMAELEAETAGVVDTPAAAPKPAPAPTADDDLEAELAALGDPDTAPEPAPVPKPAPKPEPKPAPVAEPEDDDLEAQLAALEETTPAPVETPKPAPKPAAKPAPKPEPKPEPAPEPEPEPERTTITGPAAIEEALKTVAAEPKSVAKLKSVPLEPDNVPAPAPVAATPAAKKPGLNFYIDTAKFKEETAVSDVNLDDCMMQQSSLRAYYGEQSARAEAQASRVKLQVEIAEAKLFNEVRILLSSRAATSGEKVTEKMVENAVRMDDRYAAINNRLIEAESIAAVNKHLVESLKDRRDMIIQLGADRRDESKGQARIMAQEQAHNDMKARAIAAAGGR